MASMINNLTGILQAGLCRSRPFTCNSLLVVLLLSLSAAAFSVSLVMAQGNAQVGLEVVKTGFPPPTQ